MKPFLKMNETYRSGGLVYGEYQVLRDGMWRTVNPWLPLMPQVRGMHAYRLFNMQGDSAVVSTYNSQEG